jgi:hypothetical protein
LVVNAVLTWNDIWKFLNTTVSCILQMITSLIHRLNTLVAWKVEIPKCNVNVYRKCLELAAQNICACIHTYKTLYAVIPSKNVWEHSTCSDMALSMQHQQPSTSSCSPYHSYKLCVLANHRADSPAVALDKSWPIQASNSIETGWLVILHLVFIILSLSSGKPPLKLILLKFFSPVTGLVNLFEGVCPNCGWFLEKYICMWKPEWCFSTPYRLALWAWLACPLFRSRSYAIRHGVRV